MPGPRHNPNPQKLTNGFPAGAGGGAFQRYYMTRTGTSTDSALRGQIVGPTTEYRGSHDHVPTFPELFKIRYDYIREKHSRLPKITQNIAAVCQAFMSVMFRRSIELIIKHPNIKLAQDTAKDSGYPHGYAKMLTMRGKEARSNGDSGGRRKAT